MTARSTPPPVTPALQCASDRCHVRRRTLGVMRVLVADDHVILADRIAEGLRDAGRAVDVANDGSAALTQAGLTPMT
jgi:hypothetical protein